VLLEVSHFADKARKCMLTIQTEGAEPTVTPLQLSAGGKRRVILTVPARSPALTAKLADDTQSTDNCVVLLPVSRPPLRVQNDIADPELRTLVQRALAAVGKSQAAESRPALRISDNAATSADDAWRVQFVTADEGDAYTGPFVIDRSSAITAGLSLQDAIWTAPKDVTTPGAPLITAGNVPLVTEEIDLAERRHLTLAYVPSLSTVHESPDWPILFDNLIERRLQALPGIRDPNVRLGEPAVAALPPGVPNVELTTPSGAARTLPAARLLTAPAEEVGVYALKLPETEYRYACNAVSPDESDVREATTGSWGTWEDSEIYRDRRYSLRPLLLLLAAALAAGHLLLVSAARKGTTA
jgi:hypothetical protein